MDILDIRKVGLGELLERIERLRQQLIKEGLTLAERKKPLPFLPNLIGLITGANSDAEKDVLQNAKLRWPEVRFKVQHTPVQGDKAAAEIIKAIQALDADSEVDVIILTRGGGSFQDLLVFSDEQVVRAVANCKTPIVSAIGHEADRPLTDEVADLRVSTPTDAALKVVPNVVDERKKIATALERISLRVVGYVQNQLELILGIRTRPVFANPFTIVDERAAIISQFLSSVQYQTRNFLEKEQLQITGLRGQVRALSPKLTLDRGYAVVRTSKGGLVPDPKKVSKGEQLRVTLSGGELGVTAD
jgi:exodeoxyribonuclease VII large subunit